MKTIPTDSVIYAKEIIKLVLEIILRKKRKDRPKTVGQEFDPTY